MTDGPPYPNWGAIETRLCTCPRGEPIHRDHCMWLTVRGARDERDRLAAENSAQRTTTEMWQQKWGEAVVKRNQWRALAQDLANALRTCRFDGHPLTGRGDQLYDTDKVESALAKAKESGMI